VHLYFLKNKTKQFFLLEYAFCHQSRAIALKQTEIKADFVFLNDACINHRILAAGRQTEINI